MGVKAVLTLWVPATAGLIGVGALTHTSVGGPLTAAPAPLRLLAGGVHVTSTWAMAHPHTALVAALLVAVPVLLGRLVALIPRSVHKDPQRMFSTAQRRAGFDRAGGRCEMEGLFFRRCRKSAAHGDHWFPWSKGGPTDMDNFVAACIACNCSKGAKVPTFWQTQRLAARRRRYFSAGLNVTAGGKFAAPVRTAR